LFHGCVCDGIIDSDIYSAMLISLVSNSDCGCIVRSFGIDIIIKIDLFHFAWVLLLEDILEAAEDCGTCSDCVVFLLIYGVVVSD